MKIITQVKAKVTDFGDFKSLIIEDINLSVFVDSKEAYLNDISIPKEIGNYVIDCINRADTISYEDYLTLEIEDYGLSIKQGNKEVLTIEFHGNKAVLLTPKKYCYEIRNADKLREMLRYKVSAYV
ncbi:hypothetical protein [Acidianus brierleyi]|uniref:Uncharacterized protein n=1 Tax=Acidianus brierleyi TaxID=41673 RepID=A0A2U9IEJ0_9CREN|nr:hypothetical protein [Acidianus brierleyi]AWR94458.1 hypothetical protein DFR85_07480 [Acidianus brierleyi]